MTTKLTWASGEVVRVGDVIKRKDYLVVVWRVTAIGEVGVLVRESVNPTSEIECPVAYGTLLRRAGEAEDRDREKWEYWEDDDKDGIPQARACDDWQKISDDGVFATYRRPRQPAAKPCAKCGKPVETARECYATPVCFACLPPPEPLPVVTAPAKPRRMKKSTHVLGGYHDGEHNENAECQTYDCEPVDAPAPPPAAKPRRMKANRSYALGAHSVVHVEDELCAKYGACEPVDAPAPDADTREYPLAFDERGMPYFLPLQTGGNPIYPFMGPWYGHDGYTLSHFEYPDGVNNLDWRRWVKPDYKTVEYAVAIVFKKALKTLEASR